MYVPLLGSSVKGTVQSVVAHNLSAHSLAGFVENFSGDYCCRFCTAKSCDIQVHCVAFGAFNLTTEDLHETHVKQALQSG